MSDLLTNPKARRDYHILETYEAGIVLRGTEVKSLRQGKGQIADAFARLKPLRGPALLAEQRAWVRKRDRSCKPNDEDCLAEIMRTRARALLLRVWETDGAN